MNYLGTIIDRYFPAFAALASLREIFRVSVATRVRKKGVRKKGQVFTFAVGGTYTRSARCAEFA